MGTFSSFKSNCSTIDRFNRETKALLEKVSVSQRKYMDSVERLNQDS